jgi:tetratricopeptide (TPR) repeat protein
MIEALTAGRSIPAALLREIAERSDGVPLFIEQLVHTVLESEWVDTRGDHLTLRGGKAAQVVPATLSGSLMARLDRLGPAKRVAQLAATVGREFRYALLEKVGELSPDALRDGLKRLRDAGLVQRSGSPPAETYRFKHALLQETAYQSQLRSDRRITHARVAEALTEHFPRLVEAEPAVAARHYAEARRYDEAATHYHAAGARAAERYANDEAVRHLQLALDALGELPDDAARHQRELAVCLALAPPLIVKLGLGAPHVAALHERIASLCDEAREDLARLPALLYLARYYLRTGAMEETAEVGGSLLRIAREAGIPLMEVIGRLIVSSVEITRQPSSVAIAHLERALEVARSVDLPSPTSALEPDLLAFARATLGVYYSVGGRFDDAIEEALAARARALELAHEPTVILVMALSTVTFARAHAFETAVEWGREALARAEGRGFHTSEAQAHTMAGWARVATGDEKGLEEAEAGLAQAIEIGFRGGLGQYIIATATANRMAGRYARAHELLDLLERTAEATGEVVYAGRASLERAMVHLGEGEPAKAEAALLAALEPFEQYEAPVERLMAATELLRLARGRLDEPAARRRLVAAAAAVEGGSSCLPQQKARALIETTDRR